jgi:3-oxoacyl-(acyl-carrier-protein) synthase
MDKIPVVTGISAICSLGHTPSDVTAKILRRQSRFQASGYSAPALAGRKIAPADGFDPKKILQKGKSHRYMSRETNLAACALFLCVENSGIQVNETYRDNEISLFAGTGSSGLDFSYIQKMLDHSANETTGLFDALRFGEAGISRMNPLVSFKILPNMPVTVGAIETSIKGRNLIFNPWEGNALMALNEAVHDIVSKCAAVVFCGGSDCKIHSDAFIAFTEYGLFERSGVVMSEGSAYLSVENGELARDRGAHIYCGIKSITSKSVAPDDLIGYIPSPELYTVIMDEALRDAGYSARDIDLVIDSNDFNEANDEAENMAIANIFGPVATISPKKIAGNTFAASGYISLAVAAQIIDMNIAVNAPINRIMINSFANGSEKLCIIVESI